MRNQPLKKMPHFIEHSQGNALHIIEVSLVAILGITLCHSLIFGLHEIIKKK